MPVREFRDIDAAALRECVIQFQDAEREFFPKTADGDTIAETYIEYLVNVCRKQRGSILVYEENGMVAGYTAVQIWNNSEEIHEEPYEFAYVSDLIVLKAFRGRGLGRTLLEAAESFARNQGANLLRIGVLAQNQRARRMYEINGFVEHKVVLEKTIEGNT